MGEGSAPAVKHVPDLYHEIKSRGLKIFIISSRKEYLRDATVNNLVKAGYHGWTELILRSVAVPSLALHSLFSCSNGPCCLF